MNKRHEFNALLVKILGNEDRVYFQPPEGLKMEYPCIRYSRYDLDVKNADNVSYLKTQCYQVIYIDKKPDNEIVDKILETFPMASFDRHYRADNLNHDIFTVYY